MNEPIKKTIVVGGVKHYHTGSLCNTLAYHDDNTAHVYYGNSCILITGAPIARTLWDIIFRREREYLAHEYQTTPTAHKKEWYGAHAASATADREDIAIMSCKECGDYMHGHVANDGGLCWLCTQKKRLHNVVMCINMITHAVNHRAPQHD